MNNPDRVPLMAMAGCVLTLVIAVLGARYDARASFTGEMLHYLPLAGLVAALAAAFAWYYLRRNRRV
jgi:LPXTG-motif cell wall-anchored protein